MKEFMEASPERILTREQVLEVMNRFAEGAVFTRELSDEKGLYFYEAKKDLEEGRFIEYQYTRRGEFPNKISSSVTVVHAIHYKNDMPFWSENLAEYDEKTRQWKEIK